MKQKVKKEQLTPERIRCDLKHELRSWYFELAMVGVPLVLLGCCEYICLRHSAPFLLHLVTMALFIPALCVMVVLIVRQVRLRLATFGKDGLVRDKLINAEERAHYTRYGGQYFTYHLRFYNYGWYKIPDENYEWSIAGSMYSSGVYRDSQCGDEFYLVLSRPHNGKILMAYPCKLFELAENE